MNCLNCGKESSNPKFCSRSCSASFNNKIAPKRKRVCKIKGCQEIVKSYRWEEVDKRKSTH